MFWFRVKTFLIFLLIATLVLTFVAVAYFHQEIVSSFKDFPPLVIPLIIVSNILTVFLILWLKEVDDEQTRSEFVSVITHKFRTPLTGVKWAIEMLKQNITNDQKQDILAQMENSNQRLMEIVDLMVGFAQFDKHIDYIYEPVLLQELVKTSLKKYQDQMHAKNVNAETNLPDGLPTVLVDRHKFQFVVDMLVDNAIKYTPIGGSLSITLKQDGRNEVLAFHDTGIGIKKSDQSYVFKKFYRSRDAKMTHAEGMGLGLYTAKSIVKKHHGKIWFESDGQGKGTTFFVSIKVKKI